MPTLVKKPHSLYQSTSTKIRPVARFVSNTTIPEQGFFFYSHPLITQMDQSDASRSLRARNVVPTCFNASNLLSYHDPHQGKRKAPTAPPALPLAPTDTPQPELCH